MMLKEKPDTNYILLGVIGDPVAHSLSPKIHRQFSKQLGHQIDYQKYNVKSDNLKKFLENFFNQGGCGLNITLPHKQSVIPLLENLTQEAKLSHSVNTLYIDDNNKICGDTTDGNGLLLDLKHKNFSVKQKNILVIGAGGASQSILHALLSNNAKISLYNRTQEKTLRTIKKFLPIGKINSFDKTNQLNFDAIISSVSEFDEKFMQPVSNTISSDTFCYDLNYGKRTENFKQFVRQCGGKKIYDGLGMLLAQAALSYERWTGHRPDWQSVKL